MVPNGVWKKLNPEKSAFAVLASVYTGPSVTLNLGPDGVFSPAPVDLINLDYTCNLVCSGGTGTGNVNLNVNAKVEVEVEGSLLGSDGQALTGDLNGHTYVVLKGALQEIDTSRQSVRLCVCSRAGRPPAISGTDCRRRRRRHPGPSGSPRRSATVRRPPGWPRRPGSAPRCPR